MGACVVIALGGTGCKTPGGTRRLVSDLGDGATEYRAIQGAIRNGEAELAITGKSIEDESRELRSEIHEIGDGIRELESAIIGSQGAEQDFATIIRKIRSRKVDPYLVEKWRNRHAEAGSGDL